MAKKQYLSLGGLETYDEQIKAYIDGEIDAIPSDVFIVNITGNATDGYTADKTLTEISEAHNAGKYICANFDNGHIAPATQIGSSFAVFETFMTSSSISKNFTVTNSKVFYIASNYYTESEIDAKLSTVNTSISNITSGSTPVKEAEHATSADSATNANHATTADSATTAGSATKATQDGNGKEISSTYETKDDATAKLAEAKSHADSVASTAAATVKNDLLNGAGAAYDTLKELGDLIDENVSAIDALEAVAANKKDKDFIVTLSGNETNGYTVDKTFDEIIEAVNNGSTLYAVINGTTKCEFYRASDANVWFNYYNPTGMFYYTVTIKSDNTVSFTTKSMAATQYFYGGVKAATKTDTDTVEAKIGTDGKLYVPTYPSLDGYYTESEVDGMISSKADAAHNHAIADVTNLQSTLDGKANQSALDDVSSVANDAKVAAAANTQSITAHTSSINIHTSQISALQGLVGDGFEEITTAEIQALFSA